ncbi:MAG: cupin domain-containing protein [Chloroflexi bacterium]|nr:cupin domain-containing protein [Chloroflexota bacterium]
MKILTWEEGHEFRGMGGVMKWIFWPQNGCNQVTLHYAIRQPGEAMPLHSHEFSDDIVSIIQGRGKVVTDQGEFDIQAGQSVWVPAKERHGFKNTGDAPLVTLGSQGPPDPQIYQRAGFRFDIKGR